VQEFAMSVRKLTSIDNAIVQLDRALHTLLPGTSRANRANPAHGIAKVPSELTDQQRRHSAGLMRINHTGEVCAQALYQGQAATAKRPSVRGAMERAAEEEIDHLAWCEERLDALHSRPSLLNPLFYGLSFALGAGAGLLGDKVSLGFVAATEDQVGQHLREHLERLPEKDLASRAVLEQMLVDETQHATAAIQAGGIRFPHWLKRAMTTVSHAMTRTTYYL
jgi:ubiquinone biosynthesis monooxygenase Coq7